MAIKFGHLATWSDIALRCFAAAVGDESDIVTGYHMLFECRLEMGSVTAHNQIEQRLSRPLSPGRVSQAFQDTLAAWKAYKRPGTLPGKPLYRILQCNC